MALLKKLLNKKLGQESISSQPPSQVVIQPKLKQIGGELPQINFTPESIEKPRVIRAEQYKDGKILQSPNGPIVSEYEHDLTGKSAELPNGTAIHPSKLFLHNLDFLDDYPWKDEGGEIVKRLIEKTGIQYVIIARRMLRSEAGEEKRGRMYTEMHGIVIPAEQWSVAVVPQISNVLEAKGVTEKNFSMPVIGFKTNILDKSLPNDWFDDYAKELIANVVSGNPLTIQDWDVREEDFLQKLFYCLICLPENIARQISFGAGLANSKEGEVRIAQTKTAQGLRKINGQWEGTIPIDVAFGQKYLMSLIQAIDNCTTPRQVMKTVNDIPQVIKTEIEERFKTSSLVV